MSEQTYDIVIAGSGPGGSTLAREVSRQGKKVLVVERGKDYRGKWYYGTYPGALRYSDKMSLLFTKEGLNIIRPLMVGGATSMYCGCAAPPPGWLKEKYEVDIDKQVRDTIEELQIQPLPEELRGIASTRIADAAAALGYDWYPQPKFMYPRRSKIFDCGAKCMLGCRCGAKWNAAEYLDEAVQQGAELLTESKVLKVLHNGKTAQGVEIKTPNGIIKVEAPVVVLSAGGIGSPGILQRSGFPHAGEGLAMDATVMVYGFTSRPGIGKEPPMTWSWENDADGYMLSTLIDPWLMYPLIAARESLLKLFTWHKWNKILGIMIKLKDEISGGVFSDGSISKPLTSNDRERLESATEVCKKILVEAGAKPDTIFRTPLRGTHPSGTLRIDDFVDKNLQTEVQGLYVCDASVFPEALDRPTVLTIIGLAKRLAAYLNSAD